MLVALLLILAAVTAAVFFPLIRSRPEPPGPGDDHLGRLEELAKQRDTSYATIQELEFDHQTGKLSDEDFRELYETYKADALRAIRDIDEATSLSAEALDGKIEAEIRDLRRRSFGQSHRSTVAKDRCPNCGTRFTPPARFCGQCGTELPAAGSGTES